MALPINIEELLSGRVVETERLEFKEGWNPRSYEEREPVVVRVYPDKILVMSFPGPVPPLGKDNLNKPIITPPRYRNRRLGDFFKELELTEGRCTGFPKIRRALKANGSPAPIFQTDDDREYFMVTLKINPRAKKMAAEIGPNRGRKLWRWLWRKLWRKFSAFLKQTPELLRKKCGCY